MDSGSISAIASENFPNLKTFTCGFDLSDASGIELNDERNKAKSYQINLQLITMKQFFSRETWKISRTSFMAS